MSNQRRFVDIAANLTDCVFRGVDWKGRRVHPDDFAPMLRRAMSQGVEKVIVSGTSLEVSRAAVALCRQHPGQLYCTVGVHPAHADDFLHPATKAALQPYAKAHAKFAERKRKGKVKDGDAPPLLPDAILQKLRRTFATVSQRRDQGCTTSPEAATSAAAVPDEAADLVGLLSSSSVSAPTDGALFGQEVVSQAKSPSQREADCRANEESDERHAASVLRELRSLAQENRDVVVAFGEIGLDDAELSPLVTRPMQRWAFAAQTAVARDLGLPLFLHSRDCGAAFIDCWDAANAALSSSSLLSKQQSHGDPPLQPVRGVVHSFTGSSEELAAVLHRGLDIGINASGLRTEEAAQRVACEVPLARLHLETDSPWCDLKGTDTAAGLLRQHVHGADAAPAAAMESREGSAEKKLDGAQDAPMVGFGIVPFPVLSKELYAEAFDADGAAHALLERRNEPCTTPVVAALVAAARVAYLSSSSSPGEGDEPSSSSLPFAEEVAAVKAAAWANSHRVYPGIHGAAPSAA